MTKLSRPVARIVPVASSLEERLEQLEQEGVLIRAKGKFPTMAPVVTMKGLRMVSDLLLEDRD